MGVIITCDVCHGTKQTAGKKCDNCNGTGSVLFQNYGFKVPSDFNPEIVQIYNDRILLEIRELEKLAKVDVSLKNENAYKS